MSPVESVEELYASFGIDVVREVNRQIAFYGSLLPLLRRLNVPAVGNRINEHKALREFIYKYGIFIFLKASQSEMSTEEIEKLKIERLMGYGGGGASAKHANVTPPPAVRPEATAATRKPAAVMPPALPAQPRSASGVVQPPAVVTAAPRRPVAAVAPGPADTSTRQAHATPAEERVRPSQKKRVMTSSYYGPDRRKGGDRRQKGEQRPSDTERRHSPGRRATDILAAAKERG